MSTTPNLWTVPGFIIRGVFHIMMGDLEGGDPLYLFFLGGGGGDTVWGSTF